jgi:BON domain
MPGISGEMRFGSAADGSAALTRAPRRIDFIRNSRQTRRNRSATRREYACSRHGGRCDYRARGDPPINMIRSLKMSSYLRKLYGLSPALILAGALAGCATYEKCGLDGCAGDAKVTSNVRTLLDQHPELGPAGAVEIQTLDHVVYLNGFVATGLERDYAESLAQTAPGVTRVVSSIAVTH